MASHVTYRVRRLLCGAAQLANYNYIHVDVGVVSSSVGQRRYFSRRLKLETQSDSYSTLHKNIIILLKREVIITQRNISSDTHLTEHHYRRLTQWRFGACCV